MKKLLAFQLTIILAFASIAIAADTSPAPPTTPAQSSVSPTVLSPQTVLLYALIGVILGAAGQGIRAIVGWKQLYDQVANTKGTTMDDLFSARDLLMSFGIGAVAGVCASLGLLATNTAWDMRSVLGLMAAGYAGADFIEGFTKQYLPTTNASGGGGSNGSDSGKTNAITSPGDDPNANAAAGEGLLSKG